jgi:DNA-binding NarL/FixJ family response regulator
MAADAVNRIRVVLVDDQTLVRQGLKSLLAMLPDIEVVGEAEGGEQAVALIPEVAPDAVLLDLRMPGMDGLEVLGRLREADAQPPTLILTTFDEDALLLEAVRRGARGFLLKDVSLERLAEAIRTVAAGGTMIQPTLTERIVRAALATPTGFPALDPPDPLTEREVEVLRFMAGGYSNREIADALGVAEGTVKNHISNILSKMGVRDRTRAVLKGLEVGWV